MRLPALRALRAHAVNVLLFGILLAIFAVVAGACADVTSPVRACTNEIAPFRVVMGTLTHRDTLPPIANRYTVPLRTADTTILTLYDGSHIAMIRGGTPGVCLTLRDSLEIHLAGLWAVID